ncbi:hypothetical protein HWI79_3288 [Cryptosporidium felis]|nr:hypothetical protein HWI79_3288 [Cryptosporidium felis]
MFFEERINHLEKKVDEQNEAIREIAFYMFEILDENDKLWKHVMKNMSEEINRNSCTSNSTSRCGFRSKTPPPLSEPKVSAGNQTANSDGINRFDGKFAILKLKKEIERKKREIGRYEKSIFNSYCYRKL